MSYCDFDRHTESCEKYQSNFEQYLSHPQQETESMLAEQMVIPDMTEELKKNFEAKVRAMEGKIEHLQTHQPGRRSRYC